MIHILAAIWIPTIFIATVPGGSASLLGNMYFTTWGCSFSIVGTLVWWQRDWRGGIFEMIGEQQKEYEKAKRAIRRREEKRLARLEEQSNTQDENEVAEDQWTGQTENWREMRREETEPMEDEDIDSEQDIPIVDDDDYSIPSTEFRPRLDSETSSVTSISPDSGARCSSRSLFVSALSTLPSHHEED